MADTHTSANAPARLGGRSRRRRTDGISGGSSSSPRGTMECSEVPAKRAKPAGRYVSRPPASRGKRTVCDGSASSSAAALSSPSPPVPTSSLAVAAVAALGALAAAAALGALGLRITGGARGRSNSATRSGAWASRMAWTDGSQSAEGATCSRPSAAARWRRARSLARASEVETANIHVGSTAGAATVARNAFTARRSAGTANQGTLTCCCARHAPACFVGGTNWGPLGVRSSASPPVPTVGVSTVILVPRGAGTPPGEGMAEPGLGVRPVLQAELTASFAHAFMMERSQPWCWAMVKPSPSCTA
mmetsp:Transcript_29044/g.94669  ORF Transcript_29044/g.94669 Transcript_29044/m.94669 type:complete len:305 (-) Transcript_29044:396-1310(-)